jgi:hypothetical protein
MGKTYTPAYVVVVDGNEAQAMEWRTRNRSGNPAHGAVTPEALERWVIAYGKSFEPGQCNAHISNALGAIPYPSRACIRRNVAGLPLWRSGRSRFMVW